MTHKRVIANWKMNGNSQSNLQLLSRILVGLAPLPDVQAVICPPFPYLAQLASLTAQTLLEVGAQDLSQHPDGAHTGEVAGQMLTDVGCRYVLVGHSERRNLHGETDEGVALKFEAALNAGLIPVLCVGETLGQRHNGTTFEVIHDQLRAVITRVGIQRMAEAIIAYEPVWAIGTGETATPDQAQEVHLAIRRMLAREDAFIAANLDLLYGGSVKPDNAQALFRQPDINGGLIGGASLDACAFLSICEAAQGSLSA